MKYKPIESFHFTKYIIYWFLTPPPQKKRMVNDIWMFLKLQELKFLLKILFIYLTCEQICQFIIKLASVTLTPLKYILGGFFFT